MDFSFAHNLYDRDGDEYENCLLAFIGPTTIVKFQDVVELEQFAHRILGSIKEIRESQE